MTPRDAIYNALLRDHDINEADQGAEEILGLLAAQGFVVVQADRVIQQAGKVSVTRELVESVLEDAEASVTGHYFADGKVIAALESRYIRDVADILALRAELQKANNLENTVIAEIACDCMSEDCRQNGCQLRRASPPKE